MCYNIYIMKKYCFLITFCTAAVLLSGCRRDRTTTVIYTDAPSPLTQMTYSESLPPETYSEYMATYTPETESSSEERYFSMIAGNRIFADTAVTAPPVDRGESINSLKRDTAVTTTVITVTTVPDMKITNESDEIITCVPNNSDTDSTGSISELTVSETTKTTTWYTLARPEADTGISIKSTRVSTDTSITESSDTESVTESKIS
ncbi:MAG: hypothetical protein OSJ54_09330 [Oscillospiraceae bacterium]|nr:hypothetical protein [Oscillospiraceae bacterium]